MTTHDVDAHTLASLVADATAAPSLHNAQPWSFRHLAAQGVLRLYADLSRALPRTDPDARGLHVGCGAALFNLRVAAAAAGRSPVVRLLPDPAEPTLLAEVALNGTEPPDQALAACCPAIPLRHSSRRPFSERPLSADLQDRLSEAARAEGAQLAFPGAWHVQELLELVQDAEGREALDPGLRAETARWVRTGPTESAGASDGIPAEALGPGRYGPATPVRDFTAGRPVPGRGWAVFEKNPHIALLGTGHDGPADWLRAGQALERVLLVATAGGLVTSMTSQTLEWPELRWITRDPASAMAHVQMVIRLGYGPEGHPSPRRAVNEVLDVV
ncbi:Acg family FMN-binding oxidoreductase [Streptomyces fuscichromogenes]|uniref:Nitroreductase n=1 Tax=Streptomyces fuscichromogenes TaxID=1324013 RepID=A0A917UIJ1_9ACTN|nr:nitroreductase [Streptomyces fuscichromogenes]GGM97364.1 nitroreductase [Streptomyces fuscichromogenes]